MPLVEPDRARVPLPHLDLANGISLACKGNEASHQSATDTDGPSVRLDKNTDEPHTLLVRCSRRKHLTGVHSDNTDDVIIDSRHQDGNPRVVHHLSPGLPVLLVRMHRHLMAAGTVIHSSRPGVHLRQRITVSWHGVTNVHQLTWL